mmetsp:Transcript_158153/g.384085  ORF Transcript_158153/g.384085 Transcript_158153/m.384085 type:complete len:260 (+) Transcript_158153:254-1033(+)
MPRMQQQRHNITRTIRPTTSQCCASHVKSPLFRLKQKGLEWLSGQVLKSTHTSCQSGGEAPQPRPAAPGHVTSRLRSPCPQDVGWQRPQAETSQSACSVSSIAARPTVVMVVVVVVASVVNVVVVVAVAVTVDVVVGVSVVREVAVAVDVKVNVDVSVDVEVAVVVAVVVAVMVVVVVAVVVEVAVVVAVVGAWVVDVAVAVAVAEAVVVLVVVLVIASHVTLGLPSQRGTCAGPQAECAPQAKQPGRGDGQTDSGPCE